MKQSVTLRRRTMPSGNISLYLDIYQHGVRRYEYLKLYLSPDKKDKEKNRQTLMLAEAICAKRLVEVRNGQYGFKAAQAVPLLQYVRSIINGKKGSTRRRYAALSGILNGYCKNKMMVADITPSWFIGFCDWLGGQGYASNTRAVYIASLRYIINQAYREGLLQTNPIVNIKGAAYEETNRTYLTVDEVRRLVETPCDDDAVKRAFLFGCLTGMRNCDIRAITWADVHEQGGYTRIIFRQAKTHGQEYLDISAQAETLMGERRWYNDVVFRLPPSSTTDRRLAEWVARADITKHVTFHASRHTFAVMQLEVGTDIYTVSKLLGHRDVSTTQVYAKVLDKAKRDAVDRMPNLLNPEKTI